MTLWVITKLKSWRKFIYANWWGADGLARKVSTRFLLVFYPTWFYFYWTFCAFWNSADSEWGHIRYTDFDHSVDFALTGIWSSTAVVVFCFTFYSMAWVPFSTNPNRPWEIVITDMAYKVLTRFLLTAGYLLGIWLSYKFFLSVEMYSNVVEGNMHIPYRANYAEMYVKAAVLENNQAVLEDCHRAGQDYFIAKEKGYGRYLYMFSGHYVFGPR